MSSLSRKVINEIKNYELSSGARIYLINPETVLRYKLDNQRSVLFLFNPQLIKYN